jgi:hypothetical protein
VTHALGPAWQATPTTAPRWRANPTARSLPQAPWRAHVRLLAALPGVGKGFDRRYSRSSPGWAAPSSSPLRCLHQPIEVPAVKQQFAERGAPIQRDLDTPQRAGRFQLSDRPGADTEVGRRVPKVKQPGWNGCHGLTEPGIRLGSALHTSYRLASAGLLLRFSLPRSARLAAEPLTRGRKGKVIERDRRTPAGSCH